MKTPASVYAATVTEMGIFIDILDALKVSQIAVGLITSTATDFLLCDVDADGDIDILDALPIAQFAAGLPVTLDCP